MKVGDLIRRRDGTGVKNRRKKLFLVMRTETNIRNYEIVWIYPDLEANSGYDHTMKDNYYFADLFEVVNESR